MKIPLRIPRITAPGISIVVEKVHAADGATLHAGDRLLDLRIGSLAATFHSSVSGVVADQRAVVGDELLPGRIVLWIESQEPPPLEGAAPPPPVAATDSDGMVFRLPRELVHSIPPVVHAVPANPGSKLAAGDPLLEIAMGPVRFLWSASAEGDLGEVLTKPGDALAEGTLVARLAGAAPAARDTTTTAAPTAEIPQLSLAEFRRRAHALRGRLDDLARHVQSAGLGNSAELLRAEAARLADSRFTVAVVGEFKRGKSTFLNALAGREFLPNDVIPCTAFACRFQFGEHLQLMLRGDDGVERLSSAHSVAEVAAELDRLMNDPQARIQEAIIRLPLDFCRDGVDLVDTPGLNDSEAMNQVTLSVLPNVDAAVLLMIPESPVSETERRFLADHLLASDIGRILYVLNAKDRLAPGQLPRIAAYIQKRIQGVLAQRSSDATVELIPVSARQELAQPGTAESGFADLRQHLDSLLFRERGRLLLAQTLQRVHRAGSEARAAVELRLAQAAGTRESFLGSLQEIDQLLVTTRLHADGVRRTILDAQAKAQAAAAGQSRKLYESLLGLRESLPRDLSAEMLRDGPEKVGLALTSLLHQHVGHLYQQSVTALYDRLRSLYEPASAAVRQLVNRARTAFVARASSAYGQRDAGVVVSFDLDTPDTPRFSGGLMLRIGLSPAATSWLLLMESAGSLLSRGELASTLESRTLAKLRENFGQEIERQVQAQANQATLQARFVADARRPFNDLMRRFDQELAVLLGDTVATLASLRRPPEAGPDWASLHAHLAIAIRACEAILFAGPAPLAK